ncbi:unnamed protein product, partial [Didymodactylos carnosus]
MQVSASIIEPVFIDSDSTSLQHIYSSGKYSDFDVVCLDGKRLHLHKIIVCFNSKWFESQVERHAKSGTTSPLEFFLNHSIDEIEPLFKFMYGFNLAVNDDGAFWKLKNLCEKYDVKVLKEKLEKVLGYYCDLCTSSKIRLDTLDSKLEELRQSIIIEQRNIDYFESDSKLINTLTITYNELKQQVTKNISH